MIHTVKGFGVANKAEVDVFLVLSCFFDDPADAGNLISGSSAFSKSSLNIWKFMVTTRDSVVFPVVFSLLYQQGDYPQTTLFPEDMASGYFDF